MSETIDGKNKDEITEKPADNNDDFINMSHRLIGAANLKLALFIFILGLVIFSDVFIENVMSKFSDAVDGECTTTKGTVIQLLFLVMGFLGFDLLIKSEIL